MAGQTRVSVLLVTKNGAQYLAEVLNTVRQQQGAFHIEAIIAGERVQRLPDWARSRFSYQSK
jgi:hypothetical protein